MALTIDAPLEVPRWRAVFSAFAAIPHLVVFYALNIVGEVMAIIAWFSIMFTGKVPEGIAGVQFMCLRYMARTYTYVGFLSAPYPPFTFASTPGDPGDFPGMRLEIRPQLEGRNRVTTFFRVLLVIPHVIVVGILGIVALLAYIVGFFAVLITGAWPEGLRKFVVGVFAWVVRLQGYMLLITDEYPPFQMG